MPIRKRSLTALFSVAIASCAPPLLGGPEALPAVSDTAEYQLGAGDRIRITLYNDASFSGEYGVSPSGHVSLPLIGEQKATGLSLSVFQQKIVAELSSGYYLDPRLTVEIAQFRPFYIIGEVNNPGEYPYMAGLDLRKAVAVAGGYTYRANKKRIAIQRDGMAQPVHIRIEANIELQPGDTVEIPERYF